MEKSFYKSPSHEAPCSVSGARQDNSDPDHEMEMIQLSSGIKIIKSKLQRCSHKTHTKLVSDLLTVLVPREILAQCSLTGTSSHAAKEGKLRKENWTKRLLMPLFCTPQRH
ncbi:hypothetical protein AOXY_G5130 [Acipenser oxyrinchus oxyrinchus]|uniref:BEN domain-containing protein n=1 Tax=Acipenser oxyrinchus oxyrinchus TaxID=40147 RepID=A0AAD8LQP5_ACIOX|nr:hypothetical protein AOXY_G5130 [Acipenser oxyrinchus oxyrinchus]